MLNKTSTLVLIFVLYLFFPINVCANGPYYVKGEVLKKNDEPVSDVLVRAYRNHKKLPDEDYTGPQGAYKVNYAKGIPVTIQFDHRDHHPARVTDICGSRNHDIGKVLFGLDEELSEEQKRNLAFTISQIYLTNEAMGFTKADFFSKYTKSLKNAQFPLDLLVQLPFQSYKIKDFEISEGNQNIFDTIASLGSFHTFLDLVEKAGYEEKLKQRTPFTVLAPTDKAFENLPEYELQALKKPSNRKALINLMDKWVIHGQYDISQLKKEKTDKIQCGLEVIYPNIRAKNGFVHAVDKIDVYDPRKR